MNKIIQNLKIVVDNDMASSEAIEIDEVAMVYDEIETNHDKDQIENDAVIIEARRSYAELEEVSGQKEVEEGEQGQEEDETEFHVNLNKVPTTLQNTILNEKIYLNESVVSDDEPIAKDLNFISPENLQSIYESLGLNESNFIASESSLSQTPLTDTIAAQNNSYKKEALHLYGVDELSTNDVFDIFKEYRPFAVAVEWIDDSRCNVIWKNENYAANALLALSVPYNESDSEDKTAIKPPQGTKWRIASMSVKNHQVFMRYVRRTDRKLKGAESRSKYYVKYGNPNFNNMTGLISNSKRRRMKAQQLNDATSDLIDEETEKKNEDESSEATSRQLISYTIENDLSVDSEIEEFGTASNRGRNFKQIRIRSRTRSRSRSRSPHFKSTYKRMHLYSDETSIDRDERSMRRHDPYSYRSSLRDRISHERPNHRDDYYKHDRYKPSFHESSSKIVDLREKLNNIKRPSRSKYDRY